jgi:hypothetical protein
MGGILAGKREKLAFVANAVFGQKPNKKPEKPTFVKF